MGKPTSNLINMSGNQNQYGSNDYIPLEIITIKIKIMNTIVIPFNASNWKVLEENLVFIDIIQAKLTNLISRYPAIDLQIYLELVEMCSSTIFLHMKVFNLEGNLYGWNTDDATMFIKSVSLRFKPEIELYNILFGQPVFSVGQKYDPIKLTTISNLLKIENITFDQIKKKLIP
jgi:hypothetical protein